MTLRQRRVDQPAAANAEDESATSEFDSLLRRKRNIARRADVVFNDGQRFRSVSQDQTAIRRHEVLGDHGLGFGDGEFKFSGSFLEASFGSGDLVGHFANVVFRIGDNFFRFGNCALQPIDLLHA
ncbi:MAG: hypothetical protein FD138_4466, partial [Planctomycetota bacterium]